MGWWSSTVEGVKWALSYAPPIASHAITYVQDTGYYLVKQGQSMKAALPALKTPAAKNVLLAGQLIAYQIFPLLVMQGATNALKSLTYDEQEENVTLYNTTMASTWFVVETCLSLYTYYNTLELLVKLPIITAKGTEAVTADRDNHDAPSPCIEAKCNYKRRARGRLREFFELSANDLLVFLVGRYSPEVAALLYVYFVANFIVRSATPERCDRHKSTYSTFLAAVGLNATLSSMLVDYSLKHTIGIPSWPIHKALQTAILLWHVDVTAHGKIPYAPPLNIALSEKIKVKLPPNIVSGFDYATGFITDMSISGLIVQLQPAPGAKSTAIVSFVLQSLIWLLQCDKETAIIAAEPYKPGFFSTVQKKLPPFFRNTKKMVHDPVVRIFWPDVQEYALEILTIVQEAGMPIGKLTKTPIPGVAKLVKAALPPLLFKQFGVSEKLTRTLLPLCSDAEFWAFVFELKLWLGRHRPHALSQLILASETETHALYGGDRREFTPVGSLLPLPPPPDLLVSTTPSPTPDKQDTNDPALFWSDSEGEETKDIPSPRRSSSPTLFYSGSERGAPRALVSDSKTDTSTMYGF